MSIKGSYTQLGGEELLEKLGIKIQPIRTTEELKNVDSFEHLLNPSSQKIKS